MEKNFRRLREAEVASNSEVVFKIAPRITYMTDSIDNDTFNMQFNDEIVYNDFDFDPDKKCQEIVKLDNKEFGPKGLASSFEEGDEFYDKVSGIYLDYDTKEGVLLVTCKLNVPATADIVESLRNYVEGQMSDGWGEGFEQTPLAETTIYGVFNENDKYDTEFFSSINDAEENCEEKQNYEPADEDEDYENEDSYYVDTVNVEAYYSFWDRNRDMIVDTIIDGVDKNGFDREGYNREGFDRYGRDREGYDRDGFDQKGKDRGGFDKDGNRMTKLGYLLNKDDLEGLSPEDYADLFEARRFARKRRIGEDAQAFSGDTKGMKFSKERMFYNNSDKKFYRQKNDKTDAIAQSKDGPKAKATAAVLNADGKKQGIVHTLVDGEDEKIAKAAGQEFGQPGYYGVDEDGDGKVDKVFVATKKDIENADTNLKEAIRRRARIRRLKEAIRRKINRRR